MSELKIQNLNVSYGKNEVLKDVSVKAEDKQFVSIVGPSGCGKTTLLKTVSGLLKPQSGNILYGKRKIDKPDDKFGYVFQNCVAFPWLSVNENIAFGLDHIKDIKKKNELTKYFVNAVGLKNYENAYISELSGGMKQRVALATVLARDPELILMDEPFSALDTQTRSLMQELVASIWEESKKTVLFVTHDIEEAIFLSDSVYVMSACPGTIKEIIPINLSRPRVSNIKLSQDFLDIKKHISYLVRGEAIKSAGVTFKELNPNVLKIGVHAWPGCSPLYLARELDLFNKNKLDLEIIDLEKEEDRIKSFADNNVDLFVTTLDNAVLAREKIPDLKIIMFLNQSLGGDGLIVNKKISNFRDLKGKKIAIEKGWVSHYFLLYLLNKFKMSIDDVGLVFLKGSDIGASLISGKVDAAVTFEPWLTQAKELSGGNIIASTKEYPVIYDVLVSREGVIKSKGDEIIKLINIWSEAVREYSQNVNESSTVIAHSLSISKVELQNQMSKLKLFEKKDNLKFLSPESKFMNKQVANIKEVWGMDNNKNQKTGDDFIARKLFF